MIWPWFYRMRQKCEIEKKYKLFVLTLYGPYNMVVWSSLLQYANLSLPILIISYIEFCGWLWGLLLPVSSQIPLRNTFLVNNMVYIIWTVYIMDVGIRILDKVEEDVSEWHLPMFQHQLTILLEVVKTQSLFYQFPSIQSPQVKYL